MPLDPHLLNILACPDCKLDLIYRKQVKKEELLCPKCHRVYPIIKDIPQYDKTT